jgi:timeless
VVETKLIPLLIECRDDIELVMTVSKILVMLTMPLSTHTLTWARATFNHSKAHGGDDQAVLDAIKRRKTAQAQVSHLVNMKRAFVREPEVVAVLVSIMEEPLSKGAGRSEEDKLVIELVLTLFRNLLCIEDVCKGLTGGGGAEEEEASDVLLHMELLVLLDKEYVFDVVLFLCQGVQQRENQPWNLLLMELLFHTLKGQDPEMVAKAGPRPAGVGEEEGGEGGEGVGKEKEKEKEKENAQDGSSNVNKAAGGGGATAGAGKKKQTQTHTHTHTQLPMKETSALSLLLKQESLSRTANLQHTHTRHSRFGGGLLVTGLDGRAARLVTNPFKDALSSLPQARRKRTRRGSASAAAAAASTITHTQTHTHTNPATSTAAVASSSHTHTHDPFTHRALQAIHTLTHTLITDAYEPLIKSLKDEFRRDSSRLEAGDRIVFFRLVCFFLSFARVCVSVEKKRGRYLKKKKGGGEKEGEGEEGKEEEEGKEKEKEKEPNGGVGVWISSLVHSMDMLSFHLVLNTIDTLIAEKGYEGLVHALSLYKEMVCMLGTLAESETDTHRHISLGLQYKLFYATEPMEKLHKIAACWVPGSEVCVCVCVCVRM